MPGKQASPPFLPLICRFYHQSRDIFGEVIRMGHTGGAWQLVLLTLILCAGTLGAGCLKESELAVAGIDVAVEQVLSGAVTLNVTTVIENHYGYPEGPATVQLKAYTLGTGLLEADRTDPAGTVDRGTARRVSQRIVLPREGSYRIAVVVFEGDARKANAEITVSNLERLPADVHRSGVEIQDIDFIVKGVEGGRASIQADVYFTNKGGITSGSYDVEVRAREMDAHLIADKKWTRIGDILPDTTVIQGVTLSVPDQYNYVVEVLLWKDQVIVKRGEGMVLLRPGTTLGEGERFVTRSIETSRFIAETPFPTPLAEGYAPTRAQPGFEGILALVAIAAVAFLGRRFR